MKILLLEPYFTPEITADIHLTNDRNQAFADNGYEMIVYTPLPTRGVNDDIRDKYKHQRTEFLYNGLMTVHRFSLMREGKNPICRALRYVIGCIKYLNRCFFVYNVRSCDVMIILSTPPIQGAMAVLVKKICHIPFIYNLQDIFPDTLVGTGMTKKGSYLWKIGRVIEDFTYRNADKIIVISNDCKRNILLKGVPEEKIEVIYNWVDEQVVHPIDNDNNPLFEEFGISKEKFRVVYAGNMGNAQNVNIIIDAAIHFKNDSKIEFILFGTGGLKNEIQNRIINEGLSNVKIFPLQPFEKVSFVYSLANVCIVSCNKGLGGSAMPSKTWSIMSCGRPVIANFDEGELKEILEENDCGLFTHAGDLQEFTYAIKMLATDNYRCQRMGQNGRKFILNNLTKEVGTKKYVDIVKLFDKKSKY